MKIDKGLATDYLRSQAFKPHRYDTYERAPKGSDDRRYQSHWERFST